MRGGAALFGAATACLAYVAHLVARHTIDVVHARRLLPRWDLATHVGRGWLDYHLVVSGQVHRLLWDVWLQGYWPPLLSLYQIPFYIVLGGGLTAALWSALAAFVLVGLTGSAVLWRQWKGRAVLAAGLFIGLLISSPYLLAYASVTMTETFGAFAQLLVLCCYVGYRQRPDATTARLFAISLTLLFFTKYNYFLMLAAPLVLHEWLEGTAGWSIGRRISAVGRWSWRVLSSPAGAVVALYLVALFLIVGSGGFEFRVLGQRVSVRSIGNSGHVLLYLLLAWLFYNHRRGRIDWQALFAADPRIGPLLLWFVLPVTIWMASPYPNHIRDFANLVINRPLGDASVGAGASTYIEALRRHYFYSEWLLACVVAVFALGAFRYRHQPPLMRWLILAVPMQFGVIALHQTRFPRFLLLTVVLLCLAAAGEAGFWLARAVRGRLAAGVLAAMAVAAGLLAARQVVTQERFEVVAFENYTDSEALGAAIAGIRSELHAADRLAIVGQGNELSPALFRWELGPPSGVACFPFEIGGAAGQPLDHATRVLLIEPADAASTALDVTSLYAAQRQAVAERLARGELALRREFHLADLRVNLRLYQRTSAPARLADCL